MGTRCQVLIKERGMTDEWNAEQMLYHHYDGYPSAMLPLFRKARQFITKKSKKRVAECDGSPNLFEWEAGRAGKAASYLCAADPGGFEPEIGVALHGDIQYFYVIELMNTKGGCVGEVPRWIISVHSGYGEHLDKTAPIATFELLENTSPSDVKAWIKECEKAEENV